MRHVMEKRHKKKMFPFNVEETLPHGAPCERHRKKIFVSNVEKKNCMWGAMVDRYASAMWKKYFHYNVEQKPSHEGRHGSTMRAP